MFKLKLTKKLFFFLYYTKEIFIRLTYASLGTSFFFFITYTYKQVLIFTILPSGLSHFTSLELTEVFFVYLQLTFFFSTLYAFIMSLIQLYFFLRPGLYFYENQKIFFFLALTIAFFFFLYAWILPILFQMYWDLFSEYAKNFSTIYLFLDLNLKDFINNLYDLTISVIIILFISIVFFFSNIKKFWQTYRKIIYIFIIFFSALITPPDIQSQIFLAFFLLFFCEIQFVFALLQYKYKNTMHLIGQPTKRI